MSLQDRLNSLTTSSYKADSLPALLKIADIKAVSTRKKDIVNALDKFLSDERNIEDIWNSLPAVEQELIEELLRSNGALDRSDIEVIFYKHQVKASNGIWSGNVLGAIRDDSPARLLLLGSNLIPPPIAKILEKKIRPIEVKYQDCKDNMDDDEVDAFLIIGESFARDINHVIRLVNTSKLRTSPSNELPTKAAVIKINAVLENKEPMPDVNTTINDIRVIEQSCRIYGLALLLMDAQIIEDNCGRITVGEEVEAFLTADLVGQCRFLLQAYLLSDEINEIKRIRELKLKIERQATLTPCRQLVLQYLRQCPVNKWLNIWQMTDYIKKSDRQFLRQELGDILVYSEYERFYFKSSPDWNELEGRFVQIVLLEYLSAMGIVDVGLEFLPYDYMVNDYATVTCFRLTPLGAHVLGVNDDYEVLSPKERSGIIVQANYEVIVEVGSMQEVHALYLDRFAELVSEGAARVYRLSAKGMMRILNHNISVQEIINYLQEYCIQPIPDNVLVTLGEWERASKGVRIRTVTILETDDPYLLQELNSYKAINKLLVGELTNVMVVDGKSVIKLKKEIEKKNYYCSLEPMR